MKKTTLIFIIFVIFLILCVFVTSVQIDTFSVQKGPATVIFLNPPEGADEDTGTVLGYKVVSCDETSKECSITYEKI